MDQAYEMFHEVLVKLFNDIMNIEAKAIITPEFRDITNNDMHVIDPAAHPEAVRSDFRCRIAARQLFPENRE